MNKINLSNFIEELVNVYHYKPLPDKLSKYAIGVINDFINSVGMHKTDSKLYCNDVLVCNGYDRLVIGDYGPYLEINISQINRELLNIPPRQKYRLTDRYRNNVKYVWMSIDGTNLKIYYQLRIVRYADYIPDRFYIYPYDLIEKS